MLHFGVLGPLTITRGGVEVALTTEALRRLLALLLARANQPVSADELAVALWGDTQRAGGRKTVQIYVHRLRQALEAHERIVTVPEGYRLTTAPHELDSDQFAGLVAEARQHQSDGHLEHASKLLHQASQLWRGTAYQGLADTPRIADEAQPVGERTPPGKH